jgi:hypothetical protein
VCGCWANQSPSTEPWRERVRRIDACSGTALRVPLVDGTCREPATADGKLAIRKTDSVNALTAPSRRAIVAAIRRILEAPFSAAASLACTAPNKSHVQSEGCQGASRDSAAKAGHDCDTLCCTR